MPIANGRERYRDHNVVERAVGWLKQDRRIATRYEKRVASHQEFNLCASVRTGCTARSLASTGRTPQGNRKIVS